MKKILAPLFLAAAIMPAFAAGVPAPVPKLLVIDRAAILGYSKVGQDVGRQLQALNNQAKNELTGQANALKSEQAALQQQVAILAPDVKQKKLEAFQAKADGLQAAAQRKELQLQLTQQAAQKAMADVLQPILEQIAQERGANLLLDKQAVVWAPPNNQFDITPDAIRRLDAKMPTYKVTLANMNAAAAKAPPPKKK